MKRSGGEYGDLPLFVVTGMSGAGKSQALKAFEDFGFSCIDNLPLSLLESFARDLANRRPPPRTALGLDIREGSMLKELPSILRRLRETGLSPRVLFLDASDSWIIQRYSQTRHRHPLGMKLSESIREERRRLLPIKEISDKVIDTSGLTLGELKETLSRALDMKRSGEMLLTIVSFGYKHGLPIDADIVMDVRFLPNPNYDRRLKPLTGLDKPVAKFILSHAVAGRFLKGYLGLLTKLLPSYIKEGKSYLTIGIGCTGGHHRSVFTTHFLARKLKEKGYSVQELHRDIHR